LEKFDKIAIMKRLIKIGIAFIKQLFLNETFSYLFFGGLAFLVFAIFKTSFWLLLHSGWISEVFGQTASILFAFYTNRRWVFRQRKERQLWQEFLSFASGRVALLLFSILMNYIFVDQYPQVLMHQFHLSKNLMVSLLSLFLQVFIIVVNYIYSKFVVFSKEKKTSND
jgi:putative flippase GtrA